MVAAVNFNALSNTEFHEKEAGCALSADGRGGESDGGFESDDGGASWSRADGAGEESESSAENEAGVSGAAVATRNGWSSTGGTEGVVSCAGICIAASETCSQGIGDDNETDALSDSVTGAGTTGSTTSTSSTAACATGVSDATALSSVRSEARIDSSKPASAGGLSGSTIRIEASAICSHGMCEGMPADVWGDTDSLGALDASGPSLEDSARASSVAEVDEIDNPLTEALCTGSDTAWSMGPTSSTADDSDRAGSSIVGEGTDVLASESGTGEASSVISQGITSGSG